MEHDGSLPCSEERATYPEPMKPVHNTPSYSSMIQFNIILPPTQPDDAQLHGDKGPTSHELDLPQRNKSQM
jgi:hypothetical protein